MGKLIRYFELGCDEAESLSIGFHPARGLYLRWSSGAILFERRGKQTLIMPNGERIRLRGTWRLEGTCLIVHENAAELVEPVCT